MMLRKSFLREEGASWGESRRCVMSHGPLKWKMRSNTVGLPSKGRILIFLLHSLKTSVKVLFQAPRRPLYGELGLTENISIIKEAAVAMNTLKREPPAKTRLSSRVAIQLGVPPS